MGLADFFRKHLEIRRWAADLAMLPILGAVAYLLFRAAASLRPGEAAILMMVAAGLVLVGRRWFAWQRDLAPGSFLTDWVNRILRGDRMVLVPPADLPEDASRIATALNALIEECRQTGERLEALQRATAREWVDLDGLLAQAHQQSLQDLATRTSAKARLETYGRELRSAFEGALRFEHIELDQRLRADQHRLQGQAFHASLEQAQSRLEQFGTLLEELQDTFPRLRREEDALGRLADASLRQGARLGMAVKGLVAHTPRLLEETMARAEQLQRFRTSADGVRDQVEALARRIETFRVESQRHIRSFGGAQGAIHTIDQAAQQTRLLAVNAAILAQQGAGGTGMQAIGGRLRGLADQTARGATDLERALEEHQQGIERENTGLWDLQEVTQDLRAGVQELLRVAGHLDQQGQDLARALETHVGLVDHVHQVSGRAELSLHELGERSVAIESALGRQWGVEAKAAVELEQISKIGNHLADVGGELSRISRQNVDEIWDIVDGHQTLLRSEAYRQIASGDLAHMLGPDETIDPVWNRTAWARAQRRPRLLSGSTGEPPIGRRNSTGDVQLLLLGLDALGRPEPSALASWSCDGEGRVWNLGLIEGLKTEGHRLSLLEALRESPLAACLPGTDQRVSTEGVELRLPFPYPGLPLFLAGLGLEMPADSAEWRAPFRDAVKKALPVQQLLWCGPDVEPALRASFMRRVHAWVRDDPQHESFLPWLPYEGHRPPCPWLAEEAEGGLDRTLRIRCVGLGADPSILHPLRDRLLQVGAEEGGGGAVLCVASVSHAHPEALLLRLFQSGSGMADSPHPDLVHFRSRLHLDVLGSVADDPYRAAWSLLEDLQRKGWALPLPAE